jgi:hypothetical protein
MKKTEDYIEYMKNNNGELLDYGQAIRGGYLLGLVIYIWVGGFVLCCVSVCMTLIYKKKYGDPALAA